MSCRFGTRTLRQSGHTSSQPTSHSGPSTIAWQQMRLVLSSKSGRSTWVAVSGKEHEAMEMEKSRHCHRAPRARRKTHREHGFGLAHAYARPWTSVSRQCLTRVWPCAHTWCTAYTHEQQQQQRKGHAKVGLHFSLRRLWTLTKAKTCHLPNPHTHYTRPGARSGWEQHGQYISG